MMRRWRWWLACQLFHITYHVMPAAERRVMIILVRIGTEAMRTAMEKDR